MRPILRNDSPRDEDFSDYADAKQFLVSRLGDYCSYCERKIPTTLAVEHIEPKGGDFAKPELQGNWNNFLLACVNCNSSKGHQEIVFNNLFFPDRDNTFYAFAYSADGRIAPASHLDAVQKDIANATLRLLGLDKDIQTTLDEKGKQIALGKISQRIEVWGKADEALNDYINNETNTAVKNQILESMKANGFFSVWMTVFSNYPDMKKLFIQGMKGTEESRCFDILTGNIVTPHPNLDQLNGGGKI